MELGLFIVIALQALLLAYFVYERGAAEQRAADERAVLLQRIQAPQLAVVQHEMQHTLPDPPALAYDDDAAFHDSREDLASYIAALEANGQ